MSDNIEMIIVRRIIEPMITGGGDMRLHLQDLFSIVEIVRNNGSIQYKPTTCLNLIARSRTIMLLTMMTAMRICVCTTVFFNTVLQL